MSSGVGPAGRSADVEFGEVDVVIGSAGLGGGGELVDCEGGKGEEGRTEGSPDMVKVIMDFWAEREEQVGSDMSWYRREGRGVEEAGKPDLLGAELVAVLGMSKRTADCAPTPRIAPTES